MTHNRKILLIHPPVSKPSEPPAGLARLSAVLKSHGIDCRIYDANIEGLLALMDAPVGASDTWTKRAVKHLHANLRALRTMDTYARPDRYKRAVMDVNRLLQVAGQETGVSISLANYADPRMSPVQSADLVKAAQNPSQNPFLAVLKDRLLAEISDAKPDIIGFSVNFMSQALCAFAMAGWIREHFPDRRIVFGGGLITSWMAAPGFKKPFAGIVDELVCGPGEEKLLKICGAASIGPIDDAGFDYAPFAFEKYLSPVPVIPYSSAYGCYWRKCAFCPEKAEGSGYRPFAMDAVVEDLSRLKADTAPGLIHFTDNALSPRTLSRLLRQPPAMPWYGFVRFTPHLADPDFVRGLRESGCVMLKLGIESGDQAVLNALGKGITLELVSRALRAVNLAGIATYAYLLFGTPPEDRRSAEKTMRFVVSHASEIDFLNLAIFNLPAHSPEAAMLDTGVFYPGDLSLYRDFAHPLEWHRDRVRRFLNKTFKTHPAIRSVIKRDPPFFTSNHAPFVAAGKSLSA